jgi:hypothetical protein
MNPPKASVGWIRASSELSCGYGGTTGHDEGAHGGAANIAEEDDKVRASPAERDGASWLR